MASPFFSAFLPGTLNALSQAMPAYKTGQLQGQQALADIAEKESRSDLHRAQAEWHRAHARAYNPLGGAGTSNASAMKAYTDLQAGLARDPNFLHTAAAVPMLLALKGGNAALGAAYGDPNFTLYDPRVQNQFEMLTDRNDALRERSAIDNANRIRQGDIRANEAERLKGVRISTAEKLAAIKEQAAKSSGGGKGRSNAVNSMLDLISQLPPEMQEEAIAELYDSEIRKRLGREYYAQPPRNQLYSGQTGAPPPDFSPPPPDPGMGMFEFILRMLNREVPPRPAPPSTPSKIPDPAKRFSASDALKKLPTPTVPRTSSSPVPDAPAKFSKGTKPNAPGFNPQDAYQQQVLRAKQALQDGRRRGKEDEVRQMFEEFLRDPGVDASSKRGIWDALNPGNANNPYAGQ